MQERYDLGLRAEKVSVSMFANWLRNLKIDFVVVVSAQPEASQLLEHVGAIQLWCGLRWKFGFELRFRHAESRERERESREREREWVWGSDLFQTRVWCIPEFGAKIKVPFTGIFSFCNFGGSRAISKPAPNPSMHQTPVEMLSEREIPIFFAPRRVYTNQPIGHSTNWGAPLGRQQQGSDQLALLMLLLCRCPSAPGIFRRLFVKLLQETPQDRLNNNLLI